MSEIKVEGPFYGCGISGCSAEVCYPADMLRVHQGVAVCEGCWENEPVVWLDPEDDDSEALNWNDLEPFVPAHEQQLSHIQSRLNTATDTIATLAAKQNMMVDELQRYRDAVEEHNATYPCDCMAAFRKREHEPGCPTSYRINIGGEKGD